MPQFLSTFFLPTVVMSGPFTGMRYLKRSSGSVILPKIIGTYEQELHPLIRSLKDKDYRAFIDIGAAEGFYAVGMAKFILQAGCERKIAFEQDRKAQRLVRKLAKLNGIDDLIVLGECNASNLDKELRNGPALVIMDIEGGEHNLLHPEIADFSNADILVELHLNVHAQMGSIIRKRFERSHHIDEIEICEHCFPDNIDLPKLLLGKEQWLMNEFRSNQKWFWMQRKNGR